MTQAEDEADDLLWRAQVLLEHRRRRKLSAILTIVAICIFFALILGRLAILVISEGGFEQDAIFCYALPLLMPLLLVYYSVWRCSACDMPLGRSDPQFCPYCRAQLQFLDP